MPKPSPGASLRMLHHLPRCGEICTPEAFAVLRVARDRLAWNGCSNRGDSMANGGCCLVWLLAGEPKAAVRLLPIFKWPLPLGSVYQGER